MDLSIAFAIFELIIFLFTSSLEATTIGFSAPLIHRTSPKHPLYNPHATPKDIVRQKQRKSIERINYFSQQRRHFGRLLVPPIESDVVISYFIGTPPVESIAIFDTGSSILWLQCQPCIKCFDQNLPIFEPQKSSTYQQVECLSQNCIGFSCDSESCIFDIRYRDGSYSHGAVATDTLTLPEHEYSPKFTLPNTTFGCAHDSENKFSFGTSGIVGLQNNSVSLVGQTHVDAFCYCKSEDGGYIRFGSTATLVGATTSLFTDSFGHYQVILLGIVVGYNNTIVNLDIPSDIFKFVENDPTTGVLVDSGTSYTYLHPVAWEALYRKIEEFMVGYQSYVTLEWNLCYNGDDNPEVTLDTMPNVQFLFDKSTTITLPNENVWTDKDEDGSICLKMFPSNNNRTIIGAEQLINYNVGFDLKQNLLWLDYQLACDF